MDRKDLNQEYCETPRDVYIYSSCGRDFTAVETEYGTMIIEHEESLEERV